MLFATAQSDLWPFGKPENHMQPTESAGNQFPLFELAEGQVSLFVHPDRVSFDKKKIAGVIFDKWTGQWVIFVRKSSPPSSAIGHVCILPHPNRITILLRTFRVTPARVEGRMLNGHLVRSKLDLQLSGTLLLPVQRIQCWRSSRVNVPLE